MENEHLHAHDIPGCLNGSPCILTPNLHLWPNGHDVAKTPEPHSPLFSHYFSFFPDLWLRHSVCLVFRRREIEIPGMGNWWACIVSKGSVSTLLAALVAGSCLVFLFLLSDLYGFWSYVTLTVVRLFLLVYFTVKLLQFFMFLETLSELLTSASFISLLLYHTHIHIDICGKVSFSLVMGLGGLCRGVSEFSTTSVVLYVGDIRRMNSLPFLREM